ncbi:MAG: ROK family protein [Chloroflexi bacterium]|nr:ROK family protein [Chloroflexota bacterium]
MATDTPQTFIGIDLGGTKILAAVVDRQGHILARKKKKTVVRGQKSSPQRVLERMLATVHQVVAEAGLSLDDIAAVGASAPGPVDVGSGRVLQAANLEGWKQGFDLGAELVNALGRPVFVDNDVNLGTLGEATYGAGQGKDDVIGVFIGTGIGGGIILDGVLRHGRRYAAGEIGHVMMAPYGDRCGCGVRGHIEALASRGAISRTLTKAVSDGKAPKLAKILRERQDDRITSGVIRRALEAGDKPTRKAIARAQHDLGVFIASLVNILDPQCVVLGGGLVESLGEPFLQPIRKTAYDYFFYKRDVEKVQIVPAALGDDAVVVGATVLAQKGLAAP